MHTDIWTKYRKTKEQANGPIWFKINDIVLEEVAEHIARGYKLSMRVEGDGPEGGKAMAICLDSGRDGDYRCYDCRVLDGGDAR